MAQYANWNRRHFNEIAEVLRNTVSDEHQRYLIAGGLADYFEDDAGLSNFDRMTFYRKCGFNPDEWMRPDSNYFQDTDDPW